MDDLKLITTTAQEFIDALGIASTVTVSVSPSKDDDSYEILLKTDNPGLIIGYHGESLAALQLLLGQHLHAKSEKWFNIVVNVNDYRQRRETSLVALADSAVTRVLATGQPHSLPPMPAGERRQVHLHLADHPEVTTSSEGIGRHRSVVISPRSNESQAV
jgi:spoIIIJ-associated protein